MTAPSLSARMLRPFAIDVRALAAMRIGLGVIAIYDCIARFGVLRRFYTDDGVSPREVFLRGAMKWQTFFSISGSYRFALFLLVAQAVLALLFAIGFQTRIVTILFFASSWSLINRNPMLASGGHSLAAWLLIWSIFLPVGAALSVDTRHAHVRTHRRVASLASMAILMQVALMYWNAVSVKVTPEWRSEFTAIYYDLNSHLATPLGHALGGWPMLCQALTIATLALELFGPFIALATFRMPRTRTAIALTFIAFHLGLAVTLYVGSFAFICIAAWLLFIPRWTWDQIAPRRMISSRLAPPRSQRKSARWAQAIVGAMFAYVLIVHVVQLLPTSISARLGPIAHLPRLKQSFGMMNAAWKYFQSISLEVELADGSRQVIQPAYTPDDYWNASVWWNETTFSIGYRSTLVLDAVYNEPATLAAYCDYHRRQWNQAHPAPSQQVKTLMLYAELVETPPPDALPNATRRQGKQVLYAWPESKGATRATD